MKYKGFIVDPKNKPFGNLLPFEVQVIIMFWTRCFMTNDRRTKMNARLVSVERSEKKSGRKTQQTRTGWWQGGITLSIPPFFPFICLAFFRARFLFFSFRQPKILKQATIPDKTTWERFSHNVNYPTQQNYFQNKGFAERNPLSPVQCCSLQTPRNQPFFEHTTLLPGGGGVGRIDTARMFRKMLPKYAIF